ncbi:MAG: gamma carbonic anhydrase family protein [Erysipelotrichaceae bacterium]
MEKFDLHVPWVHPKAYVHPSAILIGRVRVEAHASIWPNAVLRADVGSIHIMEGANIQDGCVIHSDQDETCVVGAYSSVGHMALLHGCTIADHVLVGMRATVLGNVVVEAGAMIGANALVTSGKCVGIRELWLGSPAKFQKQVSDEQYAHIVENASSYVSLARAYKQQKDEQAF